MCDRFGSQLSALEVYLTELVISKKHLSMKNRNYRMTLKYGHQFSRGHPHTTILSVAK